MAFKFLHAADIHLDSPMAGVLGRDDLPAEVIRNCTRQAFEAMIRLAIEEDVAFVVIAGDLYDGDWKNHATGLFFAEQMRRLGRPCFLLRGNHDAQSVITRALRLPDNVRAFSARGCETFELPEFGVALHGHSFPNRAVPEDLSARYRDRVGGMLNIGVLHTSAEAPGDHAVYAPCSVAALVLKGYDYWALGHLHTHAVLERRPWIVFPGNLQGRHAREDGAKGCVLVTVEDRQVVAAEHRAVDVLRWAALRVDAGDADAATLTGRITQQVERALAGADGRPVLARLTLTGSTALHGRLLGDTERLAAECRAAAVAAGGRLWVEKVEVRTALPRQADAADADTLAALRCSFAAALDDPALIARLLQELGELRRRLPAEALDALDVPQDEAGLRAIAADAWAIAADALHAAEA